MDVDLNPIPSPEETRLRATVARKAARKLRLLREGKPAVWSGLSMFGLVGWSVVVPTIIGAMAGSWWDRHHPGPHSWTLALLVAGLVLGCANAWHWISQEREAMQDDPEDHHD